MKQFLRLSVAAVVVFGAWLIAPHAEAWESTQWNSGVKLKSVAGGGFVLNVPACSGHLNAIQANRPGLKLNRLIVIKYKITGQNPKFSSLDPAPAPPSLKPNFRPMIQVDGDDYRTEDNRWWPTGANCGWLIADGKEHTLSIPIKPQLWSNVYGKLASQRGKAFQKVVSQPGKFNIVFGGGNSFSHGVCLKNGTARFQLISMTIQ